MVAAFDREEMDTAVPGGRASQAGSWESSGWGLENEFQVNSWYQYLKKRTFSFTSLLFFFCQDNGEWALLTMHEQAVFIAVGLVQLHIYPTHKRSSSSDSSSSGELTQGAG